MKLQSEKLKTTMPIIDLKKVGGIEGFGKYISLYEKSLEVVYIAELFYFLWSTLLIF